MKSWKEYPEKPIGKEIRNFKFSQVRIKTAKVAKCVTFAVTCHALPQNLVKKMSKNFLLINVNKKTE